MQLFLSQAHIKEKTITITEHRIVHQCATVLRMKSWSSFLFQEKNKNLRYSVIIKSITKKEIIWQIVNQDENTKANNTETIIHIALPNRMSKAEVIVQKLSELWINKIVFFTGARSIIRELKEKNITRLQTIALEATEQSFGRVLPTINYKKSLDDCLEENKTIKASTHFLLDHNGENRSKNKQEKEFTTCAYIGPEGWLSDEEKKKMAADAAPASQYSA